MYGLFGKLTAKAGNRDAFIAILKQAAEIVGQDPTCHAYIINKDLANDTTICVFEIWEDKSAHDASLQDNRVRELISQALPLMNGVPESTEMDIAGGHGIPADWRFE